MKLDKPPKKKKNASVENKSSGPVPDLEQHVDPDWWRRIFNGTYVKTDADVIDNQRITAEEVDLFTKSLELTSRDRVLDLCCGQGRHLLELGKRGIQQLDGLDRSRYLVQKARAQAKREGLNIKFREGDARKLPYAADTFDVVTILGNSFGYFETTQDDLRIFEEIFRVLKPWGRLLIDVADGEFLKGNYQPRSWEWIDKKHFVCRERSLSSDEQRLISREVVTHVEKGVIADQFYAERLYTREGITRLLETGGFRDVNVQAAIATDSERNQDLGMMERRIVITATVRKEWAPTRKKKQGTRHVVVLLGDPAKPDPLKPRGVFDDDDLYTVDQMKNALTKIEQKSNYSFAYLTNHDTFIQDLKKHQDKGQVDLVFNLCDEGYYNDSRQELHVPSLLDILRIDYTGGGPQCLAFCYDKSLVRGIAKEMGIPVPRAFFIKPEDMTFEIPFSFPVIVKPNFGDSSFGITQTSVAYDAEGLANAISEIRTNAGYEKPVLIEEFLVGKDLSVGIIGNSPEAYTVLPVIQEDYSALPEGLPEICGYEAKWLPDSPYWNLRSEPADLDEQTEKFIVECCLKLFERLECRDYARIDLRLDANGNPKLLEVNPNPGWVWDGHLAKMAALAGMNYQEMLESILQAAEERVKHVD